MSFYYSNVTSATKVLQEASIDPQNTGQLLTLLKEKTPDEVLASALTLLLARREAGALEPAIRLLFHRHAIVQKQALGLVKFLQKEKGLLHYEAMFLDKRCKSNQDSALELIFKYGNAASVPLVADWAEKQITKKTRKRRTMMGRAPAPRP